MYSKSMTVVTITFNLEGDMDTQENIDKLLDAKELAGIPVSDNCANVVDLDEDGYIM